MNKAEAVKACIDIFQKVGPDDWDDILTALYALYGDPDDGGGEPVSNERFELLDFTKAGEG